MINIAGPSASSRLTNVQPNDVQPNAVDLRIGKVFAIANMAFIISEEAKVHRGSTEIEPTEDGWWTLAPGSYEVVMDNVIAVGADEAGWVITRSTLNRNGVFLTSGLYDSGYNGVMAGCLHVNVGPLHIQRGTRIGQFILAKAEALHLYDGSYGIHKDHDKKYNSNI